MVNLGGGNAKIAKELKDDFGVNVHITNVEPYPSERALQDPDSDPISISNPAEPDFIEKSGIQPHSVDEVLAVFSVPAYLGTAQEVSSLFGNIIAMLKPGGHARISHFGIVGEESGDARAAAIFSSLEAAKDQGFMIEVVKAPGHDTLIMTAPDALVEETVDTVA